MVEDEASTEENPQIRFRRLEIAGFLVAKGLLFFAAASHFSMGLLFFAAASHFSMGLLFFAAASHFSMGLLFFAAASHFSMRLTDSPPGNPWPSTAVTGCVVFRWTWLVDREANRKPLLWGVPL